MEVIIPDRYENLPVKEINNDCLTNATRYYYSETPPDTEGDFWYYDENGAIAVW